MKSIKLVRVDFRLIHGQVVTKWKNIIAANKIIIVDDKLSKDEFLSEIYVMAAPPGIEVEILDQLMFIENCTNGQYDNEKNNILVLFKSILELRNVVEKGVQFNEVQIGGIGGGENRTSVVKGIAIDTNDVENLKYLQDKNVIVSFQVTPEETKLSLEKAINKLGG